MDLFPVHLQDIIHVTMDVVHVSYGIERVASGLHWGQNRFYISPFFCMGDEEAIYDSDMDERCKWQMFISIATQFKLFVTGSEYGFFKAKRSECHIF